MLSVVLAMMSHSSCFCGAAPRGWYDRNGNRRRSSISESRVNIRSSGWKLFYFGVPLVVGIGLIAANIKDNGNSVPVVSADQSGNGAKFFRGKYICGGVQGSVYRCTFNGDGNCVVKEIDFNKIGHNPVVSEVLAYNKLKDLQCEHIVKPVYYVRKEEKKASFIYKFANGEKIDDDSLKKKIGKLNGSSRRKLLVSIVDQLLRVVDLLHNKYGIAHGDMNHENYLIHINEKNEASVRVIDFGYCYTLKDEYAKSDVEEMCHPVTSVIHFVNGIFRLIFNFIGKNEAEKFCEYVLNGVSGNMRNLVKSVLLKGNWPKFDWRMEHINEILEVDIKECGIVVKRIREYIK